MIVSRQLYFTINLEEIFYFCNKKMLYLCGLRRFANAYYHKNQEEFQKTQYFKERFKTRYMIEAKNSELKNIHGYDRCDAAGLLNMQLQGAVSIFAVNLKRILKLMGEVCPNVEK